MFAVTIDHRTTQPVPNADLVLTRPAGSAQSPRLPDGDVKHPYQNLWSRISFCIKHNGLAEVFLIPLRMAISPVLIPLLPKREFVFQGKSHPYFYHRYNLTWINERAVEIPIARAYLAAARDGKVAEVGNVMSHYQEVRHPVVDKFERGPGVINEDILTWQPEGPLDLLLSISTFEHIGFDDDPKDDTGGSILAAIARGRSLLQPGGRLVLTAAGGYNPAFDRLVAGNRFGASRLDWLHRTSRWRWEPCDEATYLRTRYNAPYPFGNAIVVAEFGPA